MPITEELQKILQKNQLDKKTVLVKNKKIFAFCFGIYNPKIYLSSALIGLISNKEIEAVILHEKYHLENKDTLIMFIAFVSNILFPFVPIISDLLQQYRLTREINADRSAINILQDDRPLISVLKKMLNIPINNFSATASIVDDTLESRIKILANKDPKVKYFSLAHLCISTLSVLALLLIIVTPVHAVTSPIHKQSIIFCINRSSCRMVCSVAAQPNASLPFSSTQNNKNY